MLRTFWLLSNGKTLGTATTFAQVIESVEFEAACLQEAIAQGFIPAKEETLRAYHMREKLWGAYEYFNS
jgi:hypothetical protein